VTARRAFKWLLPAALLLAALAAGVVALNLRDEDAASPSAPPASTSGTASIAGGVGDVGGDGAAPATAQHTQAVARGRYLALAGNCAGCHTLAGGAAYAGGLGIPTPFGVVFAGNLTPDVQTGLGGWTAGDFWRALHNGRSRDGHLLYPAFPYTHFTRTTRDDANALFAYLRSLPAVAQANRPHELAFPYNTQAALAMWRALYFRPGVERADPARSAEWNRGAYLVRGLGHCSTCHAPRGLLGGIDESPELQGGLIPQLNWFAPGLGPRVDASVAASTRQADTHAARAQRDEWAALLKAGVSAHATASGPMAEVVFKSTQHLADADVQAITTFLAGLPAVPRPDAPGADIKPVAASLLEAGRSVYKDRCAECHGDEGAGTPGAYPRLVGNATVLAEPPVNLVRIVLEGGFQPATAANPRPHGMPPFGQSLSNAEISAVLSFTRNAWGNRASAVAEREVARYR
jgi:mono/diheme cytochrome c family protein